MSLARGDRAGRAQVLIKVERGGRVIAILVFHVWASIQVPTYLLSIQPPANAPWKAEEDKPSAWALHSGGRPEVPGSWLIADLLQSLWPSGE